MTGVGSVQFIFCRCVLDKEVVEQEIAHVKELLSVAELQRAELELDINKMRSEEIALRDALVKLQSLNEGLGTVNLFGLILHVWSLTAAYIRALSLWILVLEKPVMTMYLTNFDFPLLNRREIC